MQRNLNLALVDFTELVLLNELVHFYETFCPDLNLVQHLVLHSDVVILVLTEEGTI